MSQNYERSLIHHRRRLRYTTLNSEETPDLDLRRPMASETETDGEDKQINSFFHQV